MYGAYRIVQANSESYPGWWFKFASLVRLSVGLRALGCTPNWFFLVVACAYNLLTAHPLILNLKTETLSPQCFSNPFCLNPKLLKPQTLHPKNLEP